MLDLRQTVYLSDHPGWRTARRTGGWRSRSPGRTRLLHFFAVDDARRLVDLPGYGFARASKAERASWRRMVEGYLRGRRGLVRLMLVMDVRHPLRDGDRRLLEWCGAAGLPAHVLLSKADKLSRSRGLRALPLGGVAKQPAHRHGREGRSQKLHENEHRRVLGADPGERVGQGAGDRHGRIRERGR